MNEVSADNTLALLDQAVACLNASGAQAAERLHELKQRLVEGQFHLAVLGQFKRGKSTLLNALLGEEILPTAVVPLTAIPTFIRPGESLRALIHYTDNRAPDTSDAWPTGQFKESLARYVTEKENPDNKLGVSHVEIFHPAPLLRGVTLIDTPGIGSTLRHNTETTLNFLPQCDAAIFLVSADPPITEVEIDFLKAVRGRVTRLFFIMNKMDYLSPKEKEEAIQFLRGELQNKAGYSGDVSVYSISARLGLQAKLAHDPAGWRDSGMEDVEKRLIDFLAREKSQALQEAVSRKAGDILEEELMRLRLAVRSLQMPLEDLQARLGTFEQKIGDIRHEMVIAGDLLRGENERLHTFLEEQAEALRGKARDYFRGVVRTMLKEQDKLNDTQAHDTLAAAVPEFFERELGDTTALFRQKVADALRPHQQRADRLISSVRQTAAQLFDIPYRAPESAEAYSLVREPYWVTRSWSLTLSPIPQGAFDRLLLGKMRKARLEKELLEQVEALATRNVENLRWETFQSLNRTFARFGAELDQRMTDTVAATQGAITAAVALRERQSESVSPEIAQLELTILELDKIKEQFDPA